MSNWDFGYGREPVDPRHRRYPPPPDAGWPGGGYQADDGDPSNPQTAPYPLTYERDVFDGHPPWSTGPQQAEPGRAARPTSPGRAMPPRPGPRPAGPWPTGPWPTGPWPTGPQSAATKHPTGGQPGHPGWDRDRGSGQPRYADGQGYPGGGRHGAPSSAEPWPAGYSPGTSGSRGREGMGRRNSAGTGGRSGADPMRSLYPDGQAGRERWLDDPRGPRLEGPWWDPDSWPGWRRWLIPVAVAVLAAAIGAALVLLTGTHPGPSAAVGQANRTTPASPATSRTP